MSTCAGMRKMGWTHGTDARLELSMLILACSQSLREHMEQRGTAVPQCSSIAGDHQQIMAISGNTTGCESMLAPTWNETGPCGHSSSAFLL